jgi:two-component system sensor kinase FixL
MSKNSAINRLRTKAEAKVRKKSNLMQDLPLEKSKTLLHELEVHQVELEMQNEELREALHRLEEARDEYTDLFDFAPIGYILLNEKGIIKNINLTACDLLGIERLHIKNKPLSAYMSTGESIIFFQKLRDTFKSGILNSFELEMKRLDGTLFAALMHGTKKYGETFCRVSIQDITNIKEAEILKLYTEELEKKVAERTKELNEALYNEKMMNEMKSAFVSMASHEFRTPLTSIMSSTILIKKYNDLKVYDKEGRQIARIQSSVKQLINILEDFLSMEKLERGIVLAKKDIFDLKIFTQEIVEEFELIRKEKQKIIYGHEGDTSVLLDKKILRNIYLNLISNAIKYSKTHVEIFTSIENSMITISIKDKGIGIPKEEQKHLFTKFFRAKNVTNIQGTGLGLSIVKHYLELLEGNINFTSEVGLGSTFIITFPHSHH